MREKTKEDRERFANQNKAAGKAIKPPKNEKGPVLILFVTMKIFN
jgi:hypothetical protein